MTALLAYSVIKSSTDTTAKSNVAFRQDLMQRKLDLANIPHETDYLYLLLPFSPIQKRKC